MWLNSLTITTHCSMKVNIKTIFLFPTSILFEVSSIFSLLFSNTLSRYSNTLSPLFDSPSLLDLGLALPNAETVV